MRDRPGRAELVLVGLGLALVLLQAYELGSEQLVRERKPHWDDLTYHGPMIAHWLQAKRLVLAPFGYQAYYPGTGELLSAWFMLPTRLDAYAALSGLFWMSLGAVAVAQLVYTLTTSTSASVLAVAMLLACRPFTAQAQSLAAVDLATASLTSAALAFTITPSLAETARALRARMGFVGGLCGLAMGAKITFAPLAILLLLFLWLDNRSSRREVSLGVVGFVLAALACGGYWYARNFWLSGNPFFPAALLGFEGPLDRSFQRETSLLAQLSQLDRLGLRKAFGQLLDWPSVIAWPIVLAYVAAVGMGLSSRAAASRERRHALLVAAVGALLAMVITLAPFSGSPNWQHTRLLVRTRFFLAPAELGVVLVAFWLAELARRKSLVATRVHASSASRVQVWFVAFLYLAAAEAARVHAQLELAATSKARKPLAVKRASRGWAAYELPADTRVTWFSSFDPHKYYQTFGPELRWRPIAVRADGSPYVFPHSSWRRTLPTWRDVREPPLHMKCLLPNLQSQRIEHVLVRKRHKGDWPQQYLRLRDAKGVVIVRQGRSDALLRLPRHSKAKPGCPSARPGPAAS